MTTRTIGKSALVLALVLSLLCIMPAKLAAVGIGLAPTSIEITDAVPGATYQKALTVFNTDTEDTTYTLTAEGEAADWVSFHDFDDPTEVIESIFIPGEKTDYVLVKFNVPPDAAHETYTCTLYAAIAPAGDGEGGGTQVTFRMSTAVTIEVSGIPRLEGKVNRIAAGDVEAGFPVSIEVDFTNTGNVAVQPDITATILQGGSTVDEIGHAETAVAVNARQVITLQWDTTGQSEGDYTAEVSVSLGDTLIAERQTAFTLLPSGTAASEGGLISLQCDSELPVNDIARVEGTFLNPVSADVSAKLVVNVYYNLEFVEKLESSEVVVSPGEEAVLMVYFEPSELGDYSLRGHVSYGDITTETKDVLVTVSEEGAADGDSNLLLIIAVSIVVLGLIIYLVMRMTRRKSA